MKISYVVRMGCSLVSADKKSLVRATNDTGNLIREIALCPNNGNWRLEIQPDRRKKNCWYSRLTGMTSEHLALTAKVQGKQLPT
jgi:hypothetical protein